MKPNYTASRVFLLATGGALVGMLLGGVFGLTAGYVAPDLFRQVIFWTDIEPIGTATVFGAFAGVLCGGILSAFAIMVHLLTSVLGKLNDDVNMRQ